MADGVPPEVAKAIVREFLERCRGWGTDREIPKQLERLRVDPNPIDAAKLHQWTTWVAFLDHARRELDDGTLDHWFAPPDGL